MRGLKTFGVIVVVAAMIGVAALLLTHRDAGIEGTVFHPDRDGSKLLEVQLRSQLVVFAR
ncbi:MAG: hypothetical protein E6I78_06320 [Chloroflexi bacterium]|nr:MAG: hypothetical protein E6I78_06320 [Chloroflexota bacterium]